MAGLLAAGRMGPQRAAGLVGCLRLAEHVWSPLAVGQVGRQLAARGVPIAAPRVLIPILNEHLPAPGLSIQSLQQHLAARWTLQPTHQHLPVPGMPCQSMQLHAMQAWHCVVAFLCWRPLGVTFSHEGS